MIWTAPRPAPGRTNTSAGSAAATWCCGATTNTGVAKPQIREVIIKGVKEESARVAGLLAGQADLISNVPIEDVDRIAKHPRIRLQKVVGFRMYFLGMNVTMKPFDNKLLRQAINYALNPHVMLKHIYDNQGAVVNGPLGSNWVGFDPKSSAIPTIRTKRASCWPKAGIRTDLRPSSIWRRTATSKARRFAK